MMTEQGRAKQRKGVRIGKQNQAKWKILKGEWPRAEKSRAQANQCLEGVS